MTLAEHLSESDAHRGKMNPSGDIVIISVVCYKDPLDGNETKRTSQGLF